MTGTTARTDGVAGDPRQLLLSAPMSPAQWTAIGVGLLLCALDGFDVLAITFAAPAIAKGWGVTKAGLGVVFSAGLLGMAAGSFFVAPIADVIGRRPMVLLSLAAMIVGTLWTAAAGGITPLLLSRLITGLGVGAMIATINPLGAEYSNVRRRELAMSILNVGYPIGGVIGGFAAAALLPVYGWRAIFVAAAAAGGIMLVVTWFALPEPLAYLLARRRNDTLVRVNRYLARCGHAAVTRLPVTPAVAGLPTAALFRDGMTAATLRITGIYLLYVVTLFFMQNWLPTLVVDLGFMPAQAAKVAAWLSVGGIAGGLTTGAAAMRFGLKPVVVVAIFAAAALTALFGLTPPDLAMLSVAAALTGFVLFGGIAGIYVVVAQTFPARMRASGTGFAIGIGRLGSVASPIIVSGLFAAGLGRVEISAAMASAALLAGLLLLAFPIRAADAL